MIGSAVVGNHRIQTEEPIDSPTLPKRFPSAQGLFWISVAIVALLGFLIGILANLNGADWNFQEEALVISGLILAVFAPLFLWGACLLAMFLVALRIDEPYRAGYWWHLGKIALGILVGSIVGILLMLPVLFWM